ncbi:MAG: hypothetical protein A3E01_08185 [Gammaproteobacteria bacterium RIFCSPHIGHO2_12_FULL_63_22]|nr:MAG: hypothetical protein A3E01_08185 [Gammaproteobacteria bacterium RIFCSPHIGHO2_12_FULL_63_22]
MMQPNSSAPGKMAEGMPGKSPVQEQKPQEKPAAAQAGSLSSRYPKIATAARGILLAEMKLLYSTSKGAEQIAQAVQNSDDPVAAIMQVSKAIVEQVKSQAKGVPPEFVQRTILPVAVLVTELAVASGAVEDSPELNKKVTEAARAMQQGGQGQASAAPDEAEPVEEPPKQEMAEGPQGLVADKMMGA